MWAKDTGLPYEVALASVKRTNSTRVAVAVDKPLVASEQRIADAFTELKLIPKKVDFADFVDPAVQRRPAAVDDPGQGLSPGKIHARPLVG